MHSEPAERPRGGKAAGETADADTAAASKEGRMRTSSYVIYVDLPDQPDRKLLVCDRV